jgi:hypothetical protein
MHHTAYVHIGTHQCGGGRHRRPGRKCAAGDTPSRASDNDVMVSWYVYYVAKNTLGSLLDDDRDSNRRL